MLDKQCLKIRKKLRQKILVNPPLTTCILPYKTPYPQKSHPKKGSLFQVAFTVWQFTRLLHYQKLTE